MSSVGAVSSGVELQQGHQDEAAAQQLGMRDPQPLGAMHDAVEEQDVHVDQPRAVAGAAEVASERPLKVIEAGHEA